VIDAKAVTPALAPGRLHSTGTGVAEPDPDASYVAHMEGVVVKGHGLWAGAARAFAGFATFGHAHIRGLRGGRLGATMERLRRDIGWWLSYIPRLIGHFRSRRQLGQSVGPALRSARERMRQSRSGLQRSPRSRRRRD
jgi:hypothetical protein